MNVYMPIIWVMKSCMDSAFKRHTICATFDLPEARTHVTLSCTWRIELAMSRMTGGVSRVRELLSQAVQFLDTEAEQSRRESSSTSELSRHANSSRELSGGSLSARTPSRFEASSSMLSGRSSVVAERNYLVNFGKRSGGSAAGKKSKKKNAS